MIRIAQAQWVMGTLVEITSYIHEKESDGIELVWAALREFERLERVFSRFDDESELFRVNREAAGGPVGVTTEFIEVLTRGQQLAAISEGCFSICMGPLISLWADSASRDTLSLSTEIQAASYLSDSQLVTIDREGSSIRFIRDGVSLDLGGLVKGYAVDRAKQILEEGELAGAMISAGSSSIAVFGQNPAGNDWQIGIRHPMSEDRLATAFPLRDQAISTSGTYERSWRIRGCDYSHLIDPRSGRPLEGHVSATAMCLSAMEAEFISKLLIFLGCERALEICDAQGWQAEGLTVTPNHSGDSLNVVRTASFPIHL